MAWELLLAAFISSTLLPGGSELLLDWYVTETPANFYPLIITAIVGNVAGSMLSFFMGWLIALKYPLTLLDKPQHKRAKRWIDQYGAVTLLLAWLPVIGDPLCLIAGWLRLNPLNSFIFILVGKSVRYFVIAWLALEVAV
jgi:membrane protein YqaA with SNARE-associated domain